MERHYIIYNRLTKELCWDDEWERRSDNDIKNGLCGERDGDDDKQDSILLCYDGHKHVANTWPKFFGHIRDQA